MKKVFIIEDDTDLLETLASILEEEGHTIVSFDRAKPVYKSLHKENPDVVIADVMLPDGDGREIATYIKKNDTLWNTKVILISAIDGLEKVARSSKADAFLKKPFTFDDLFKLI